MKKILFAITLLIATASIAVCVAIQRHAASALQERADSAAAQAQTLANLDTQNQRLSQIIDKVKNTEVLSHDEMLELAKLRHDVGQARQLVAAKPGLQAKNARLRQTAAERQKHLAEAQALPNYWPKDQLSFAGYATPDDALKSMLWTMTSGNLTAWQSNCTPEAVASLQKEWQNHGLTPDQQQAQLKILANRMTSGSEGFHIVSEQSPALDQQAIDLSFDGEDVVGTFVLKKIGDQWKFHDMQLGGQARTGK